MKKMGGMKILHDIMISNKSNERCKILMGVIIIYKGFLGRRRGSF